MNNEQKDGVEQFVYRNPQYQAEFELIQKARLQPDFHVVFPDKTILYRSEEEDEKVFVIRWWKIAAAAVVFIFLSGLGWYVVTNQKTPPVIVKNSSEKTIKKTVPEKPVEDEKSIARTNPVVQKNIVSEINKPVTNRLRNPASTNTEKKSQAPELLTVIEKEEKNNEGRNIQIASTVTKERPDVNIRNIETSPNTALQNNKQIIDEEIGSPEPNPYAFTASNDEIEILNTTVSKKNKLRGIFRKVSRVVEKTTNIETGDGRGIRIANFEFALK